MRRAWLGLAVLVLVAAPLLGCGKPGSPRPMWLAAGGKPPKAVEDLSAEVKMGRIWVAWTEPTENIDRTRPANLGSYMIYYNAIPLEEDYCLTCPMNFSQKVEFVPTNPPVEAIQESGRISLPLADFSPANKYVFVVVARNPQEALAGDSNVATLNWPVKAKESR